jgi:hypothetical protein
MFAVMVHAGLFVGRILYGTTCLAVLCSLATIAHAAPRGGVDQPAVETLKNSEKTDVEIELSRGDIKTKGGKTPVFLPSGHKLRLTLKGGSVSETYWVEYPGATTASLVKVEFADGVSEIVRVLDVQGDGPVSVRKGPDQADAAEIASFRITKARPLQIVPAFSSGFQYAFPSRRVTYSAAPTGTEGQFEIRESRNVHGIDANLSGMVFILFDDDFGSSNNPLVKLSSLGLYNPHYHRFGLLASINGSPSEDPTFRVGFAWFLDREATVSLSYGVMFRQTERLDSGKPGDIIGQDGLRISKEWKSAFFIGLTFNFVAKT